MNKTNNNSATKKNNNSLKKNENTDKKSDSILEGLSPEATKDMPPDIKKVLEFSSMSMSKVAPMQNPLADKINEKHIDKILELAEKDDERSFKDAGETRKFTLIYIIIFVALFIFLTIFLVGSDKELYKEVIKLFAIFLGGFGSGFGIKSYMERNK